MDSMVVRYLVSFPQPQTHYASVNAILPAAGQTDIEVFMPVWTPGSYMIREYSRHMENVSAADDTGMPLAVTKIEKNRWRVDTVGAASVHFQYRVYCREMSVRTNWVEDTFALLQGAPTFVALQDGLFLRHEVFLALPAEWSLTITGLDAHDDGQPHHYVAANYDMLVDSPILLGNPELHQFSVEGIPHFLANQGGDRLWDGRRAATELKRIVESHRAMWGGLPYSKYVFLNMITEGGGGLEHANSVCMMTSRWSTRTRKSWLSWLNLVSHEFFHVWNIKRLRPTELGPFDYNRENYTRSLWIAEGITDYYAPLLVRRAAISTRDEYLEALSGVINLLQTTPGRLVQSAEQTSFDAWIKLYRPDENSGNTTISYYTKGTVIGWLLERASAGRPAIRDHWMM